MNIKKLFTICFCFILLLIFNLGACSGIAGIGGIVKRYTINNSKREVRLAYTKLLNEYPRYEVSRNLRTEMGNLIVGPEDDIEFQRMHADSVNFYFYFKEMNLVLYACFTFYEEKWDIAPCELVLKASYIPGIKWIDGGKMSFFEKRKVAKLFETEILSKLNEELSRP